MGARTSESLTAKTQRAQRVLGRGSIRVCVPTSSRRSVSLTAIARGLATFTLTSQVLEVDGTTIPADTLNGSKRVILCPDSAVDGRVTSGDLLKIALAFGQGVGDPDYTVTKDPDENGVISSGDQLATVAVFLQYCVQRVIAP